PNPAASASHRRCATRSSASSACRCATLARNRSRTSTGRSASIRSSRRERAHAAIGWAGVSANIAGSRPLSGPSYRGVAEAEAAIEMGPNEVLARSALAAWLSMAGRHDQAIEWASTALRQEHNAAFAKFLKPNLAWVLYLAGRYEEALENIRGNEMVAPDTAA